MVCMKIQRNSLLCLLNVEEAEAEEEEEAEAEEGRGERGEEKLFRQENERQEILLKTCKDPLQENIPWKA